MPGKTTDKTIFITGACSYVGKWLVEYLIQKDEYGKIITCCRNSAKNNFDDSKNIIKVTANLLNPESYKKVFEDYYPDHVIHLAAIARFKQGEENPDETIRTNLLSTIRLIELANEYNVERFLNVSSNLARNPKGVTGFSKYLTEVFIKNNDFKTKVISIRLPNVIDSPGAVTLIFKRQIELKNPITITDKRMSRKFITPDQAAEQLIYALTNGENKDIIINNRPSTPIVDLAKQMIKESGKDIPIEFIGIRPGEKLQEEDYPQNTIKPTDHDELFVLTENQHNKELVEPVLKKLSEKISDDLIREIKGILNF